MNRLCTAALVVACLACTKKEPAPAAAAPPGTAAPAQEPAAPAVAGGVPDADEIKPVYSSFAGPVLPLAEKLCGALHRLSAVRRAACCHGQPGTELSGECAKIVSGALRNGGLTLDAAAVDKCVAAREKSFEGCSWVGGFREPLPAECRGLFAGKVAPGAVCRSSLECRGGLHCDGVGPLDPGRCQPQRADGESCGAAVDSLVVFTMQHDAEGHAECTGYCGRRRCEPRASLGAACLAERQCAPGLHCDGKVCAAGALPAAGDKCLGGCAAGSRCVAGVCKPHKADGAACTSDNECRGGCLPATHVCGMRCDQL